MARRLFDLNIRRGRVKFESPNVVSYVAKAVEVATWLIQKRTINLKLGGKEYPVLIKPWMMKLELKELRLREVETNFWILALRVPLDAMCYLPSAVEGLIGGVKCIHPPEADRSKPKLMNIKLDMDPQTRFRVEDTLSIESPKGELWTVQVATPFSDWCRKCRWYFHTEDDWPRQAESSTRRSWANSRLPRQQPPVRQQEGQNSQRPNQASTSQVSNRQPPGQQTQPLDRVLPGPAPPGTQGQSSAAPQAAVQQLQQRTQYEGDARTLGQGYQELYPAFFNYNQADRDLSDPFRLPNPEEPGYTWYSNIRGEGDQQAVIRHKLDYYALVSKGLVQRVTYVRQVGHPLSDHKPVLMDLVLSGGRERGRSYFKLNSQNLEDQGLLDWVREQMASWRSARPHFTSTADWLDGGLVVISGVLDVSSRILARHRNKEEEQCRRRVEEAEGKMEMHPISTLVWAKERETRTAEWKKLQLDKQSRWEETLKVKGILVYDRMTRETFRKLLPSSSFQQVVQLDHPFDQRAPKALTQEELLEYARIFYANILTTRRTEDIVDTDLSREVNMWEDTAALLEETDRLALDRPITEEELKQTGKEMAPGKCPGRDGLTVEFYRACGDVLFPPLVEVYNEVLGEGKLGGAITHGVISVMFKKGDKAHIRNYRPISVLNVNYKLLAKTLALRLGRILPKLVERDQGAFVHGRSIFVNILTVIESIEVIQEENLDPAILLLDMEKAYDRVGWSFVLTTLRKMGFGQGFCKWVIAMYTLSSSTVQVNGHLSRTFQLSRSLRQGCPLAPLLFVLQLEVPLNRIRKQPRIRGLPLSANRDCRTKALADDLFLISANTAESLEAVKSVPGEYSLLSKASVN
ncbi:hypothetical protein CBR_g19825 [Chara braunii]|uniref:Reverse transcriptase domain-containing protein n=1 Tax=Chara braunii TaxID=69332 RepID=A0A388JUA1_CHABU|nr:hypothetical protein CBR_g19825 [Chara braunii]|eukprot:GBG61292.1 hypothetical protein CBR_g19825 [Chara braunii]